MWLLGSSEWRALCLHFYWKVLVGTFSCQALRDTSRWAFCSQEALPQIVAAPGSSDKAPTSRKSSKPSSTETPSGRYCVSHWAAGTGWGDLPGLTELEGNKWIWLWSPHSLLTPCCLSLDVFLSRQTSALVWNWKPLRSSWCVKGRGQGEAGWGGALPAGRGRSGETLRLGLAQKVRGG